MPIFGDFARFAVEYELGEDHGGEWMLGRFCYRFVDGRIGDYDLGTSLRDVLFQLDQLLQYRGRRGSERFRSMSAPAAFALLDTALYGAAEPNEAALVEYEQWARHKIFPEVDVFDGWKGFLVEDERDARLLVAHEPYVEVKMYLLESGEIDAVLNRTRDALNEVYECIVRTGQ